MTTTQTPAERINDYLAQCNGADTVYRHLFNRFVFTEGVKFVADVAGAYWLIDAVASHQLNHRAVAQANGFQVWRLKHNKTGSGAVLTMDDGGQDGGEAKVLVRQRIPFTDFPKGCEVVLYLEDGVLMLKEER